jgi:hypothetical protein
MSIFTCPSLRSSHAVPKKAINNKHISVISTIPTIGRFKKYLMTISVDIDNIRKASSILARMARKLRAWSNKEPILISNFMAQLRVGAEPFMEHQPHPVINH